MICENCMRILIENIERQKKERQGNASPSVFDMCTNMRENENGVFYSLCDEQIEKAWDAVVKWVKKKEKKVNKSKYLLGSDHPWLNFLNARAESLYWSRNRMKYSDEKLAYVYSMDPMQVKLILMSYEEYLEKEKKNVV